MQKLPLRGSHLFFLCFFHPFFFLLQAAAIAAAAAAKGASDAAQLVYALFTNDPSLPISLDQVGQDAYDLTQAALAALDAGSYDTALYAGMVFVCYLRPLVLGISDSMPRSTSVHLAEFFQLQACKLASLSLPLLPVELQSKVTYMWLTNLVWSRSEGGGAQKLLTAPMQMHSLGRCTGKAQNMLS